jgi:hypothetical protein
MTMRLFKDGNERGAAMVEMAIVVPIFILLVFGMLEFGLAFKNKLTMNHAVSAGARRATVLGNDASADIEILTAFEEGLVGATSVDNVQYVDIFLVNDDGSKGVYSRYTPDADGNPCDWDPCPDPVIVDPVVYGSPDDYPPCSRDVALEAGDGVDTVGFEVVYTHNWVTGVLGFSDATWHETARSRMEPDLFGSDSGCP